MATADPYTAQQARNRRVLKIARATGDPQRVIDAANRLYNEMHRTNVWPDSWSEVQRAHDDALLARQYGTPLR